MRTNAWGRVAGLGLAAAVLTGCKSVEGVVEEHAAAIRPRIAVMRAIHEDAAARPPLDGDDVRAPAGGFTLAYDSGSPRNTTMAYLEDLERPGELADVYARIPRTDEFARCAALVEHQTEPWDPDAPARWNSTVLASTAEGVLRACERFVYVFVIRATEFVRPTPVKTDTFDGGRVRAEVLVYALEADGPAPFSRLGGFRVEAESSTTLSLYDGDEMIPHLESDLRGKLVVALSAGAFAHAGSAQVQL